MKSWEHWEHRNIRNGSDENKEGRRSVGRPSQYQNNEEGFHLFIEETNAYMRNRTGKRFSMKGWAEALGVTRTTLYSYMKRGGVWHDAIIEGIEAGTRGNAERYLISQ